MSDRAHLGLASTVALVWVLALVAKTHALVPGHPNWSKPWDHQKYAALAAHPFDMPVAPFRWRLLVPLMAKALPFGQATSFRVVTIVAVWLTAVAMFVLLRRIGFDARLAGAGMLLFLTFGWLTGYPLYNIWLPDAMVCLVIVLLAIAALDRRPVVFAVLLLTGALMKEQVLIAAPLWYTLTSNRLVDRRRMLTTALLSLPALIALAGLHLLLPAGPINTPDLTQAGLALNKWDLLPQSPGVLFATFGRSRVLTYPVLAVNWTVGAFGTIPLLALCAARKNARVAVRWGPYLAAVYLQPMFASNTKRLIALAFPVMVIMALHGIVAIRARLRLRHSVAIAIPLVLLVPDYVSRTNIRFPFECLNLTALFLISFAASRLGDRHVARIRTWVARVWNRSLSRPSRTTISQPLLPG